MGTRIKEDKSFSEEVKSELSNLSIKSEILSLLELASIHRLTSSISLVDNDFRIRFTTKSQACVNRVERLVGKLYGFNCKLIEIKDEKLKKNELMSIELDEDITRRFLSSAGLDLLGNIKEGEKLFISRLSKEENAISYLRGAFLGGGSVTDPSKDYYLELVCQNTTDQEILKSLLDNFNISSKLRDRNDKQIIYIKKSDYICDFLTLIGATNSYLKYEEQRIYKSTSNRFNRTSNFETSNLDKQIEASARQIADLEYIEKNIGLEALPDNLKEVAIIRLKHREASIREVGKMLSVPLSKSGVNYRLKKIEAIAKDHRGQNKWGEKNEEGNFDGIGER